jgi:hypothetical protein
MRTSKWIGWAMLTGMLALAGSAFAQAKKTTPPPTTNSTTAQIIFQGTFPQNQVKVPEPKLIYSASVTAELTLRPTEMQHQYLFKLRVVQGKMDEIVFALSGTGDVYNVKAKGMSHWSVRRSSSGQRSLVIVPTEKSRTQTSWSISVSSWQKIKSLPAAVSPLVITPSGTAMFDGAVILKTDRLVAAKVESPKALRPLKSNQPAEQHFRFANAVWSMRVAATEEDPDLRFVRFKDFKLTGQIDGEVATFKLSGVANVRHPDGGTLSLLSSGVALTEYREQKHAQMEFVGGRYRMKFATNGEYPIEVEFNAQVTIKDGWSSVSFAPVAAPLREVTVSGFSPATKVYFTEAAQAQRKGDQYLTFLPAGGSLGFRWQETKPKQEVKLFYSVSGVAQVTVSPGLMRQMTVLDYKVMQGKMQELTVELEGEGSVTRVDGRNILTWKPEEVNGKRLLKVQLNTTQTSGYQLTIHTQTPLGAFPLKVKPVRFVPVDAIRYGGHIRVVNQGAVRLEVLDAPGLAQISPQRFPTTKLLPALNSQQSAQAFAFRFSGPQFGLEIQADNILPELAVSQMLVYRLGETEVQIDAELELDIREAPLREFTMSVPDGFTVAQLTVPSLSDYGVTAGADGAPGILRIQFSRPLIDRQVMQLRLTKSHNSPPANWTLPMVAPVGVKSLRGFVGVSAEAGLRLSEGTVGELTEIATAFFPLKVADLQLAYRLRAETWSASVNSERLELSVQADTLHLFSVAQGIAYGSSLFNYTIAGAPVSVLRVASPTNYANVEFVGNEIRGWNPTTNGYEIHLHTPVAGAYSLVATYDMKFNATGDVMAFDGLTPLDVQSEQGYLVVVSSHQFTTEPANVSPGLIRLEKGEVPVEYQLLLDAPMLAAYQYTARPYVARLKLTSLGQGETVNQVVDRATFRTRISSEGNALTDLKYLVKSKGYAHLRITMPAGEETKLWSVRVQGREVVPVTDQSETLIPLPQNVVPNTIIPVDLKIASKATDEREIKLELPKIAAPILLADWQVQPDEGYRLKFRGGVLSPQHGQSDVSGFAWLSLLTDGRLGNDPRVLAWAVMIVLLVGSLIWHWATADGTFRFGLKNGIGGLLGAVGVLFVLGALGWLCLLAGDRILQPFSMVNFMIPVQAAETALAVDLENIKATEKSVGVFSAWPVVLGLFLWGYMALNQRGLTRRFGVAFGWMLVFWGCLRMDNGAREFFAATILFVVVHVAIPLIVRQGRLPKRPKEKSDPPETPVAGATALLLMGLFLSSATGVAAKTVVPDVVVDSVEQRIYINGMRANVAAEIKWRAEAGQTLDFLRQPAVLKKIVYPVTQLKLTESSDSKSGAYRLTALTNGTYAIKFEYEVMGGGENGGWGFSLPTHYGLINRVNLSFSWDGYDLLPLSAVSIRKSPAASGPTVYELALAPTNKARISWRPRARDVSAEKAVFYAELRQLFMPAAGVIEGIHEAQIRTARGQLTELEFATPPGMTITEVTAPSLKGWRFDPDEKKLSLQFEPAQGQAFAVKVLSQYTAGTLPFERKLGLLKVVGAANEIGQVGVATGSEVVLESLKADGLTAINLEDFPATMVANEGKRVAGLALRRAYRYSDSGTELTISASAVQPDIRVLGSQTLSLGEDRSVLAANLTVSIARAGVFKLSFAMPENMDVDSITGAALSHWTGFTTDTNRIITLHLKGKTEGQQAFALSLVGPGPSATNGWVTPRVSIREAGKQSGQLMVVPEQGMRLHVSDREGLTQLDPKKAGITQRGVTVFRLLHADWRLGFDIEKVDPWVQVSTLQDVSVREGQLKVNAWLEYKIENAGVKSLSVRLPDGADAVQFVGDHVADSIRGAVQTNTWEIKLQRRVIGVYRLNVSYNVALPLDQALVNVGGLRPLGVDLQRGFLTLRTSGRLDIKFPNLPASLQVVDWQTIPASLREKAGNEANFALRVVEPDYSLGLNVVRHDAAKLLPARVVATEISSVLSASGMMLTSVRLMLHPGDKRSMRFTLPADARFWFASVNQASVRPWREGDKILLPLEQNTKPGQAVPVDFLYSVQVTDEKKLRTLEMQGPKFDLPLEHIAWSVFLPPTWELQDWDTKLQIQNEEGTYLPVHLDLQTYVQDETQAQQQKTQEAEQQLALGNKFLAEGRQQQARQAFRNAYSLSQHDYAFNEDTRVQLQKLKMQQAVVGLNYRRHSNLKANDVEVAKAPNASLQILTPGRDASYTQEQVRQALRDNDTEENSLLMRLAQNVVEQQDAAQAIPEAIRASVPKQGTQYTFTRSLQVDTWADLSMELQTATDAPAGSRGRMLFLGMLFLASLVYMFAAKRGPAL